MPYLTLTRLSFGYETAAETLFSDLTLTFPEGWSGIVGANGSGKSTLLRLAAGVLTPDSGRISRSGSVVFCEQEVDEPPANARAFFENYDPAALALRRKLDVCEEQLDAWPTLSMGQRRRLQLAAALAEEPDLLCVDEPTNHLDVDAREAVMEALRGFRGVGLLVSHDRALLDALCRNCLFLSPGGAALRPGNLTQGLETARQERTHVLDEQHRLRTELKRSKNELQRRKEKAGKADSRDSKRNLASHDADSREKINRARLTDRAGHAGRLAGAQADAVARNRAAFEACRVERQAALGLSIPYGRFASINALLDEPETALPLGPSATLFAPPLRMEPHDRIALTGPNGSGKTSLLRHLLGRLKIPSDRLLYMPQELDETLRAEIQNELERLPRADYSRVMTVVASLGSDPARLLDAADCSPGEWRKLFFGLGVLREVNLIVMDEPTNHLDLPSIQCLEAALAGCDCALLLISHDAAFLDAACTIRWHIDSDHRLTVRR